MSKDILLGAFYTDDDGLGVTGLTVTIDVWRVAIADLASTEIVTAGSCTSVGDGLYVYRVASADLQTYYYFGVCKTAGTVAQAHLAAVQLDFADSPGLVTLIWNALTSGMSTAGSIGKRITDYLTGDIYARLGAPEGASVSADIAALADAALGAGASEFVVTVDDGTNPLDGAEVWVTTDSGGSNVVASGVTEADGTVTFMLDAGGYYLWKQRSGINFTNPEQITVT